MPQAHDVARVERCHRWIPPSSPTRADVRRRTPSPTTSTGARSTCTAASVWSSSWASVAAPGSPTPSTPSRGPTGRRRTSTATATAACSTSATGTRPWSTPYAAALDHLDVGNHHLVSGWRAAFAERLAATTGGALPGVVFGVSGGEAVDLAIKVARAHTGRPGVVSALGGYHGCTGLAMSAGSPRVARPVRPDAGVVQAGALRRPPGAGGALREGDPPAAVLLEAIPATLGMPIPSPGYLAGVRRLCDEHGVMLILDEVQTGLGRTGTFWFYEQEGAVPDLLVTGKGLSGGVYPITATLMSSGAVRVLRRAPAVPHLHRRRCGAGLRGGPGDARRGRGARLPRAGARARRATGAGPVGPAVHHPAPRHCSWGSPSTTRWAGWRPPRR